MNVFILSCIFAYSERNFLPAGSDFAWYGMDASREPRDSASDENKG